MTTRFVFIHLPGQVDAIPAGRLELVMAAGELRTSRFRYGDRYPRRQDAIDVDPVSLPLADDGRESEPANGLELFGAIRDASPDSWGRRVIENRLRRQGPLPEVDYLDNAGSDRSGALDIRRDLDSVPVAHTLPHQVDLDYLLEAVDRIEDGEPVPARLAPYFEGGPTLGGMRPKAVVVVEGRQYVAKFPSKADNRFDVPRVEFATLRLAQAVGLDVPDLRLVELDRGRSAMLIERFDRVPTAGGIMRRHMVSALTMLGKHESEASTGTYADLAGVINSRGVGEYVRQDRIELFRRMVFNILVTNNDDHLRNHAFLFDRLDAVGQGRWRLSPLYDVVPSPAVGFERFLAIGVGEQGRLATLDNALSHAGQFGLRPREASELIQQMTEDLRPWKSVFENAGVPPQDIEVVAGAFRRGADIGLRQVERAGSG